MDNGNVSKINKILQDIIEINQTTSLSKEVQLELGRLVCILTTLKDGDEVTIKLTELAIYCLLRKEPNFRIARYIGNYVIKANTPIREKFLLRFVRSMTATSSAKVILGLGAFLYVALPILVTILPKLYEINNTLWELDIRMVILVAISGALGSIVSIMVRVNDFHYLDGLHPAILFFNGAFKPIIGLCFAVFIYAIINSGLIPIQVIIEEKVYFYLSIGFVAGFSERFAKDIAVNVEKKLKQSNELPT